MIWQEFESEVPELARRGWERFERTGVGLLGTLRRDGSPRISPVEPRLAAGHLLLGLMAWSKKALDLRRDPRCVLHSSVSDPNGTEGEFKLYGRGVEVRDEGVRQAAAEAWWTSRPPDEAVVVSLEIESAVAIDWDVEQGEMVVTRWSPGSGVRESRRAYP